MASAIPRFRFGIQLGIDEDWPSLTTASAWTALAKRVESLGYSTLLLADHFRNTFAPFPALAAAAGATSTLRLGTLAVNNDLRHPVVLANEASTLDILSGGRVELGIGAGWDDDDYVRSGIRKDPAAVRIARLEESLQVVSAYLSDATVDFEGTYYQVHNLYGDPKPIQRPRPPISVGGGGRKVLSLAARYADIVGINPPIASGHIDATSGRRATAEATDEKVAWIREAAGPRLTDLELSIMVFFVAVTDDAAGTAERLMGEMELPVEDALSSPHALIGSIGEIRDELVRRRERYGVGYWVFQGVGAMESLAPVVAELAGT